MSGHTPGPWRAVGTTVWADSEMFPASIPVCIARVDPDEERVNSHGANARLIAAAPELLAALSKLQLEAQHFADNKIGEQFLRAAIEGAHEAIAKATGGEP